ncbi:MAG: MFS transporter [Candidatus Hodarchaeales archaeon]
MDRRSTIAFIKEQSRKNSLDPLVIIILAIYFMWHIAAGLIQPFINPYFFELSEGNFFLTGLLNGIPFFSMVFSVFIFGSIVDRIGSKKVILFGFVCYLVQIMLLIFIHDALLFFIIYVLMSSLTACFIPAVQKYASLTREDVFGLMAAIASLGYFFGSVSGGLLYDLGITVLFMFAIISCIAGVVLTILAKDIRKSNSQRLSGEEKESSGSSEELSDNEDKYLTEFMNPSSHSNPYTGILIVLFMIAIISSFQAAFSGQFITVYLLEELEAESSIVGFIFGGATLMGFFTSHYVGVYGKKTGKFKPILVLCFASYAFVWISYVITVDILILSIIYTLPVYVGLFVAAPTIITLKVSEDRRGTYLGIFTAFQYAGFAIGSVSGGLIAGINGTIRNNFAVSAVVCFLLVVVILIFFKED